ncbi:MAG: AAA family ATPase, partial [bacterium]|nr:AAA family ATPase [bacterium]
MLRQLSIGNFLLIHRLDLDFEPGLTVLTGETGAGKSILLEALGFCLGGRSQSQWVQESQTDKLTVTTTFEASSKSIKQLLQESDIEENQEDPGLLMLRRSMTPDGRTRAFINDQPVSVSLLKSLGDLLVEVHGQFDRFLDPASQRTVLDRYGGLTSELKNVSGTFEKWQSTLEELVNVRQAQQTGVERVYYLKLVVEDLITLSPEKGEEECLSTARARLANRAKLEGALRGALSCLQGDIGIEPTAVKAYRTLDKVSDVMEKELKPTLEALGRIIVESTEISQSL